MNKKRTIVFRADGNSQIGLGHVMRCIALCEMLRDFFHLKFAIHNPAASVLQILKEAVDEVLALPETMNYTEDADNFSLMLSNEDLVVIDGYYFDAQYQKKIKSHCSKLIFIDDLVSGHQYADVVINHNGLVQAAEYDAETYTSFLLGTQYALVRKEFFEKKSDFQHNRAHTDPIPLLINLGGADPENVSLCILNALLSANTSYTITLIVGAANKNIETFKPFDSVENVRIKKGLSASEMIVEIDTCAIAIISCSTIAYEVSILNKPFVGILTASNQQSNAVFFERHALALAVLDTKFTTETLLKSISYEEEKWNETIRNQRLFFDGKTIERFQHAFLTI